MKTPEQMYYEWRQSFDESLDERVCEGHCIVNELALTDLGLKVFLAGYQAAKDQLADAGKVMNSSNNSNGWISVKERLPEDKESVIYWHDLHGTSIGHYDSTYPKPNYHWWSYCYGDNADFRVHWWMPLPKIPEAPKGEE